MRINGAFEFLVNLRQKAVAFFGSTASRIASILASMRSRERQPLKNCLKPHAVPMRDSKHWNVR